MCRWLHQIAQLFSKVCREMITLHFSFRGRHSGKGPAAVSTQSKVGLQWKTDHVAHTHSQNIAYRSTCFVGKEK